MRAAIGALLPQVSLLGEIGRTDAWDVSRDATTDSLIGLHVTLPFYSGGFNYSRVREAQAQVESNESDITTTMRDTAQNVGAAWSDLKVADATITAGKLEVKAAQIAFDGVREEAKVGARTTLDVLNAEQELLNARGRPDRLAARRIRRRLSAALRRSASSPSSISGSASATSRRRLLLRLRREAQFRLGSERRYRLDTFLPAVTVSSGTKRTRPGRAAARGDSA